MKIQLTSDGHFLVGKIHINSGKPCQDHALYGNVEDGAVCAIVADGCSTGKNTDMGARVLTFATRKAIHDEWLRSRRSFDSDLPSRIGVSQLACMGAAKSILNLDPLDSLATCGYTFISPEGGFVHIHGDGAFALKYRDGSIAMTHFEWENNMPSYPAYGNDGYRDFIKVHGDDISADRLALENLTFSSEGDETSSTVQKIALGEAVRGTNKLITAEELKEIEFIAVFSDGVSQVEGVSWQQAVKDLLAFKVKAGEFAKRRLIRFVDLARKNGGVGPLDDISYAVVCIYKEEE
jgi:hypothetical protein